MMNSCKNPPYNLYALHGFLGLYSDWNPFSWINHPVVLTHESLNFRDWANNFNASIANALDCKNILLGYSMGGRLAMHAALSSPTHWDAAIFISAHPGLTSPEERSARLREDEKWAERFLHDPWEILMRDWNSNPVFGTHPFPFPREEKLFNRKQLAGQLVKWSLGNQEPLLEDLKKLTIPTLYIAGALDTKFCTLLDPLKTVSQVSIIPEAAHRVPWDQPSTFTNQINNFIQELL